MATFAKSTFNAATYSASRPTYPAQLFEYIFAYHRRRPSASASSSTNKSNMNNLATSMAMPRWERAVDVGCGTGQATAHLSPFREIIGIDPSPGMLAKARAHLPDLQYTFRQGSAEDMRGALPDDGSVDLLIAAQAAHWFDWNRVWPETSRVLRAGGTAAFWVYAEFRLTQHPSATPLITSYLQGPSSNAATSLGPHFERPGRTVLERHLVDVPEPPEACGLAAVERVYFCGDEVPSFIPPNAQIHSVLMCKSMRWRDLLAYFRTFSALHTYHERYPADLQSAEDARFHEMDIGAAEGSPDELELRGGDIAIRFWKDLRKIVLDKAPATAKVGPDDELQVEWPVALILTHKL